MWHHQATPRQTTPRHATPRHSTPRQAVANQRLLPAAAPLPCAPRYRRKVGGKERDLIKSILTRSLTNNNESASGAGSSDPGGKGPPPDFFVYANSIQTRWVDYSHQINNTPPTLSGLSDLPTALGWWGIEVRGKHYQESRSFIHPSFTLDTNKIG